MPDSNNPYSEFFTPPTQGKKRSGDGRKTYSIRIPPHYQHALNRLATKRNTTLQEIGDHLFATELRPLMVNPERAPAILPHASEHDTYFTIRLDADVRHGIKDLAQRLTELRSTRVTQNSLGLYAIEQYLRKAYERGELPERP